jgi:molecular chaperone GrpE
MVGEDATSGDEAVREAQTEEVCEESIGMSNEQGSDERVVEAENGDVHLLEELVRLRHEADEARERHVRLLAEFDNFRRRSMRERSELVKYQGEQIVLDLLDVIDNVERAMGYVDGDPGQFRGGVELIFRNFQDLLEKWGVRLETAIGKQFNPSYQSALSIVPSPDSEPGTVVNELKKAAFYKDKLIRVGEVVVAGQSGSQQEV